MKTTKFNKSRRTSKSKSRSRKPSHFVLAVDPFVDSRYQANAFHLAGTLQRQTGCSIEPTFVLSGSGRGLVIGKDDLQHWLRLTDVAFSKLLKNFDSLSSVQPKILVHKSPFIRMDVKTLVSYAKSQNAAAIIINTQAKSALERGVLGSFAETLVLHSAVPVIAIPPKAKLRSSIKSILFPTDFGPESSAAFPHCVSFAKSVGAKVTLLHEFGAQPFTYPEGARIESNAKWTAMANKDVLYAEKTALLERWKVKAKKGGVSCSTKLTTRSVHIADVIISETKTGDYDLVAMAATKGPGKAWFTGSTPRFVLRHTQIPVWVYFDPTR